MADDVKVFAMYLPQYHVTEENSKFWGEGFTDWVSVKKSTPLFEGHHQPQIPLNDNYYDLSNVTSIKWQASIAKKYNISGWGIYHYWFNSKQKTLTKPAEIILANRDIDIPFFFAWDNASWKRTWSKLKGNDWAPLKDESVMSHVQKSPEILIEYKLGNEEDWKEHFEYCLPYFQDARYVKHNGCPIFLIYNYSQEIRNMEVYWNKLAKNAGFNGIEIIYSYNPLHGIPASAKKFTYEPLYSGWGNFSDRLKRLLKLEKASDHIKLYDYETVWKKIIANAKHCHDSNQYYGAFVGYDDSPRRGNRGKAIINASPELFEKYLQRLVRITRVQRKEFIFLTAWNEWGEGAHLEPDSNDGFKYLNAYKNAIKHNGA